MNGSRLAGKVAVITGTASGIGRAAALLFAQEGAAVVCVDWDATRNTETTQAVEESGGRALAVLADVGDPEQVDRLAALCAERYGRVDVLFANAGLVHWSSVEECTAEAWQEMLRVNLSGPFFCAQKLLPLLKASGRGSVVLNGSIDGLYGNPRVAAYSAAKGGLIPLTHVLAHEFGPHAIRVNCLAPGGIVTGMTAGAGAHSPVVRHVPLGRLGTADEVAQAALFLASDESSYTTGAVLVVDGGRTGITIGTTEPVAEATPPEPPLRPERAG